MSRTGDAMAIDRVVSDIQFIFSFQTDYILPPIPLWNSAKSSVRAPIPNTDVPYQFLFQWDTIHVHIKLACTCTSVVLAFFFFIMVQDSIWINDASQKQECKKIFS